MSHYLIRTSMLAVCLTLFAAGPEVLGAQGMDLDADRAGEGFGLKANAGFYTFRGDLGGDELGSLDEGFGFEAVASWGWAGGFELGVGAGIASHDLVGDDDTPGGFGEEFSADVTTIFLEPLYRFNVGAADTPHLHPFLGARLGYTSLGFDEDFPAVGEDDTRSGFQAGGEGGLEVWFTEGVGIVGTVSYDYLSYDLEDDDEFDADDEDTLSGGRLGFLGGLKVRFQ